MTSTIQNKPAKNQVCLKVLKFNSSVYICVNFSHSKSAHRLRLERITVMKLGNARLSLRETLAPTEIS